MAKKLNILFMASELSPLVITGGLADVAGALPAALAKRGHDVRIVMPCYARVPREFWGEAKFVCEATLGGRRVHGQLRESRTPGSHLPLYLVEHDGYFGRDGLYDDGAKEYADNAERFCFYVLAAFHGIAQTGWKPDVVHCNDWHTAAAPAFLKTHYARDPFWGGRASVFTIHNLAFQGRYGAEQFGQTGFDPALFTPAYAEFHGDMNLMKMAVVFADKVNTVSPRYAREIQTPEYGSGLDEVLRRRGADLSGILNGVDYGVWRPDQDSYIASPYSARNVKGKASCKRALQQAFGLPEFEEIPLFSIVSRLTWQKGIDLLLEALPELCRQELQIVVLGNGDAKTESAVLDRVSAYPGKVAAKLTFDSKLSHQVYAGSDFFLMPSRYEPCGLSQLYSLAYGAVPVVRKTGGLADSVYDCNAVNLKKQSGTGFSFTPITAPALSRAVARAVKLFADPAAHRAIQRRGMEADFSWGRSSAAYESLYHEAMAST